MAFLQVKTGFFFFFLNGARPTHRHMQKWVTPPPTPRHAALLVTDVLWVGCDSIFTTLGTIQSGGVGETSPWSQRLHRPCSPRARHSPCGSSFFCLFRK